MATVNTAPDLHDQTDRMEMRSVWVRDWANVRRYLRIGPSDVSVVESRSEPPADIGGFFFSGTGADKAACFMRNGSPWVLFGGQQVPMSDPFLRIRSSLRWPFLVTRIEHSRVRSVIREFVPVVGLRMKFDPTYDRLDRAADGLFAEYLLTKLSSARRLE